MTTYRGPGEAAISSEPRNLGLNLKLKFRSSRREAVSRGVALREVLLPVATWQIFADEVFCQVATGSRAARNCLPQGLPIPV